MFSPKPAVEFQHSDFGTLTLDSRLWHGIASCDGRQIPFYVGGTTAMPDTGLLQRVHDLSRRYSEVEQAAVDIIRRKSPSVSGAFTLESVDFLWEDKPHLFALVFTLAGDEDGLWRVEFENGEPKFSGRDD